MDELEFERLTVGLLIKREGGMFGPSGLGIFYDPTQKVERSGGRTAYGDYDEETIYGKHSRIGGKHKYPNVDPMAVADIYVQTLKLAGIDAENPVERELRLDLEGNRGYVVRFPMDDLQRGRTIFEFLSTMYYNHRNVLTSFIYLEGAKKKDPDQATIVTLGSYVRTFHSERFQPIYIGGTEPLDRVEVDKSTLALEFYGVGKKQVERLMDRIKSKHHICSFSFEGLPADQVAYTHSVMWDNADLPRGDRANFIRRGLIEPEDRDKGELVAYSLFPVEMEKRLNRSLNIFQNMASGSYDLLQKIITVHKLIREVVKDEYYADFA